MRNFSKSKFVILTIVFGLLLIPSFLAAYGEDEGTFSSDSFWIIFAKLFYILRFPSHTLFWTLICKGGVPVYFLGLFFNCAFYGLITERIVTLYKLKKI